MIRVRLWTGYTIFEEKNFETKEEVTNFILETADKGLEYDVDSMGNKNLYNLHHPYKFRSLQDYIICNRFLGLDGSLDRELLRSKLEEPLSVDDSVVHHDSTNRFVHVSLLKRLANLFKKPKPVVAATPTNLKEYYLDSVEEFRDGWYINLTNNECKFYTITANPKVADSLKGNLGLKADNLLNLSDYRLERVN